jgi:Ca-activated chloride channel family protein
VANAPRVFVVMKVHKKEAFMTRCCHPVPRALLLLVAGAALACASNSAPSLGGPQMYESMPYDQVAPAPESTESYAPVEETPFKTAASAPLSTFSVDVDTASYANVRRFLNHGQLPPEDAVRVEEMINYFDYDVYAPAGVPIGVETETTEAPWAPEHRLTRVTLAASALNEDEQRDKNLVFLIDTSGSMGQANKLPLLKQAMGMLIDQLTERDRVSIVVYAGSAGLVLPPTPGTDKLRIHAALAMLGAGGSTNGGAGIQLAYKTARDAWIEGGTNRVILATDGDFNVGTTSHGGLLELIKTEARTGVYLTVLGLGMGNYKDDTLELLADRGNGNYGYIDSISEARKILVDEIDSTLVTVAKDVKIQIAFDPERVASYRLIGYENRRLADEDFVDDKKDAGDVGAGHRVTALYEWTPTQQHAMGEPFMEVRVRYKDPKEGIDPPSTGFAVPASDDGLRSDRSTKDMLLASAVATFGLTLRHSEHAPGASYALAEELARSALGDDERGLRAELIELIGKAQRLDPRARQGSERVSVR